MVSSSVMEKGKNTNGEESAMGIPAGDYRLVGWDMDATGKKHIDEICQIAGYTPSCSYSQYVMPYRNLNPTAIKRHNMKVVTIGKYRMLKNSKTNKVLKTKSEVSALCDFLTWLESVKGDAADGVILVYHEPRKVIPAMLLESLKKYNLVDRFKETVKGFVNGYNVAEAKYTNCAHTYSLRALSRNLLEKEEELDNAKDRACLALQVLQYLSVKENDKVGEASGSGDSDAAMKGIVEFIRKFVQPIHVEEEEHAKLKVVYERESSLQPIFGRANRKERQHVSPLRRLLAEAGLEYTQLQDAWSNGKKEGLEKLIREKLSGIENKTIEDLMKVLESYFNSERNARDKERNDKRISKVIIEDKKNNNKCEGASDETPDTSMELMENGRVAVEE